MNTRQEVTLLLSDPWELGESISWKPLHCLVLEEGVRPVSSFGKASEAVILRLIEPFTYDGVYYEYLQGHPRHADSSFKDLKKKDFKLSCSLIRIPLEQVDSQPLFDLSWWRGGGSLIGTLMMRRA